MQSSGPFFAIYENRQIEDKEFSTSFDADQVRRVLPECCGYNCDGGFDCKGCPAKSNTVSFGFETIKLSQKRETKIQAFDSSNDNWTIWMSASVPSGTTFAGKTVSGGEFESLTRLREKYDFCDDSKIVSIECREKIKKYSWEFSDNEGLICDIEKGFQCSNRRQAGKCLDFEVRFYCSVNLSSFEPGGGLMGILPEDRQFYTYDYGECTPGWTDWFDNSKYDEAIGMLKNTLRSCTNPVGIQCRENSNHQKLQDLDQSGYNPQYECNLKKGLTCKENAPCKKCLPTSARLYCPCSNSSLLYQSPRKVVTKTTIDQRKYVHCCSDENCDYKTTCFGSCWTEVFYWQF